MEDSKKRIYLLFSVFMLALILMGQLTPYVGVIGTTLFPIIALGLSVWFVMELRKDFKAVGVKQ